MDKPVNINIVTFNVPSPPNYGGVIDVYYKLKALHAQGAGIILHCFDYGRGKAPALEKFCRKVYYYKRQTGLRSNFSFLPYNVYSRRDPELLLNLSANDYPILFESLHTCYYLDHPQLRGRLKIYRESNIEHDYYRHLAQATRDIVRKTFFRVEAWRYKRYEPVIRHAGQILTVSTADEEYIRKVYPGQPVAFMPCFHANDQVTSLPGQSDFLLYHGNLSVDENEQAALYLIRHVFSRLPHRCVLAGMNPSARLLRATSLHPHIEVRANPSQHEMDALIRQAQIQVLITFQDTGLKLKLLNSLFSGRHVVVNSLMLTGTGLDDLCTIANTPGEMISACNSLMHLPFSPSLIDRRKEHLFPAYSNAYQAERLMAMLT